MTVVEIDGTIAGEYAREVGSWWDVVTGGVREVSKVMRGGDPTDAWLRAEVDRLRGNNWGKANASAPVVAAARSGPSWLAMGLAAAGMYLVLR